MNNQLIEYLKLHIVSLNQDLEKTLSEMDSIEDLDSDEYKDLEIMEISLNGQFIATMHILEYIMELTEKGLMVQDMAMNRMQMLEDALYEIQSYTKHEDGWRPGLVDVFVYSYLMDMHEIDTTDESPELIWQDTPDHIMEHITKSGYVFDLEYGTQDLWEALRDYLLENKFVKSVDEEEEE